MEEDHGGWHSVHHHARRRQHRGRSASSASADEPSPKPPPRPARASSSPTPGSVKAADADGQRKNTKLSSKKRHAQAAAAAAASAAAAAAEERLVERLQQEGSKQSSQGQQQQQQGGQQGGQGQARQQPKQADPQQQQQQEQSQREGSGKVRRRSGSSGKAAQPPMKRRRYAFALGIGLGASVALLGMLGLLQATQQGYLALQPREYALPGGLNITLPLPKLQADLVSTVQMHLASSLQNFSGLNLTVALPSISMPVPEWLSANMTMWEMLSQLPGMGGEPSTTPSDSESLLRPGKQLLSKGYRAKHPVVIIPGFVTSGLELWEGKPCATKYFRQRMWGTLSMMQTYLANSACWFEHMSLDPETGLDPEGVKIRAAQGLEAVDFFIQGYWVWGKLVEALADIGYDTNNLVTAPFDWRLAVPLMEARDGWFTRLRYQVESLRELTGEKAVLTSHSYGENVARSFMHWIDERQPGWLDANVEAHVAIAGTTLGVPKAITAVLSGEMRDTAQLGALASYLTNNLIPREARVRLFRSWASVLAMFPVGGPKVWGNGTWAPDDTPQMRAMGRTYGAFLTTAPLKSAATVEEEHRQQQEQEQALQEASRHGGTSTAPDPSNFSNTHPHERTPPPPQPPCPTSTREETAATAARARQAADAAHEVAAIGTPEAAAAAGAAAQRAAHAAKAAQAAAQAEDEGALGAAAHAVHAAENAKAQVEDEGLWGVAAQVQGEILAQHAAQSAEAQAQGEGVERAQQCGGAGVGECGGGEGSAGGKAVDNGVAGCVDGGRCVGGQGAEVGGAGSEGAGKGVCASGFGGGVEVAEGVCGSGLGAKVGGVNESSSNDSGKSSSNTGDSEKSSGEKSEAEEGGAFNRYSSAVSGISNALRQWILRDTSAGPMLDLSQAQSLDIRQAIDTALEAAGPRYRDHYAEWGAVHYHSAHAEAGISKVSSIADTILKRIAGTVQQAQSAATSSKTPEDMRSSMPRRLALFPNALTTPLPNAPSVKLFCFYGTGLPTERAYHYLHPDGWTPGKPVNGPPAGNSTCTGDGNSTCGSNSSYSHEQGTTDKFLINTEVHDPDNLLDSGIQMQEDGDVTVPLISLGLMGHSGWRSKRLNPSGMRVVSREYKHMQAPSWTSRGGPATGQHVDILGNEEMLSDVLKIATGHGDEVQDRTVSRIGEIASNIDFEDPEGWE